MRWSFKYISSDFNGEFVVPVDQDEDKIERDREKKTECSTTVIKWNGKRAKA